MWYKILNKRLKYEWEVKYFAIGKEAYYKAISENPAYPLDDDNYRGKIIYLDVNVKNRFDNLKDRGKIRHRFKYNSRSVVEDFFNYYAEWEFDENEVNIENCKYLLTEYKNRRVAYGAAWNISKYTREEDELIECPACNGKLVHESTWSIREFRDQGFWERYDYFILYLRGGKMAVYPIIHPEKKRKKVDRDKIEDAPKIWKV